jgi:hypothetical protein
MGVVAALLLSAACHAAELTATENRWLQGAGPVLLWARDAGLPLDIVVQPQPMPDAPPLALAFIAGRCKFVLSMRGNPEAQATLDRIEPELLDATLELMTAHELGHCRRYLDGNWYGLPAGFVASVPATLAPDSRDSYLALQAARREEGYADLVGLAWTQTRHPQQYQRLHAWLLAERSGAAVADAVDHDTRAWARLAARGEQLAGPSVFDSAAALWAEGLVNP